MLTESYIKMTRKSEVNKGVHEPCHAINKQSVKLETITIEISLGLVSQHRVKTRLLILPACVLRVKSLSN